MIRQPECLCFLKRKEKTKEATIMPNRPKTITLNYFTVVNTTDLQVSHFYLILESSKLSSRPGDVGADNQGDKWL